MRHYKVVKGQVGPWAEGQIVSEEEIKAHPGMGGTNRLVDELKVLQETFDVPPDDGKTVPPGQFAEVKAADFAARSPANTSGHAKPGVSTAADADADPNAPSHGKRGRS